VNPAPSTAAGPRWRWIAGLAAVAAAAGCARTGQTSQPSLRATDPGDGQPQRIVFAPKDEPAGSYNDPPVTAPPSTPIGDAVIARIEELSAELGKAPPAPDGRLFAAATDLAGVTPSRGTVAYRLVEFALQRHGIIEPSPHLLVIRGPIADPDAVLEQLSLRLVTILAEGKFARVGVGTARRGPGDHVIVLALQSSFIETEPVPRALPNGGRVRVAGRIAPPYRQPHVYITRENGEVASPPVRFGAEGEFTTAIDCGDRTGRQQVEITASDRSGSTVLANFPIWCREVPPVSITVELTDDDAAISARPGEAEKRMVEMVNRDRVAHGLAPVAIDDRVTAVARAHSQDMIETGVVGHISPNTGSASDRVAAHGIKTAVVLENVARAYGLAEAQDGLMNSPGHRANVLSSQATHVGVGIVLGEEVAGRREMYVTQVFIRIPSPIERDEVIEAVAGKLAAVRAVGSDPWLAEVAQTFADSLAAGVPTKTAAAEASVRLRTRPNGFRGVSTVATTVADVESFDAASALADGSISSAGIGVAQGDHPEIGESAIFIVVLLGHH
jgi:uncharacterized protein YkwD